MAREIIGHGAPGVAGFSSDDGYSQRELLIGDVPPNGAPEDLPVAANSVFPLYSVVGLAAGVMALATADGAVKARGVLMVPVANGATPTTARIHKSGHFNMNTLAWHAGFTTDALKAGVALENGTNILIGKNPYDLV